jgi:hypothetical protein
VANGQRVAGIDRRSAMLASGRYAMLDDGMGLSLVPWRAIIEQKLGLQLAAAVRSAAVSWEIGRSQGASITWTYSPAHALVHTNQTVPCLPSVETRA